MAGGKKYYNEYCSIKPNHGSISIVWFWKGHSQLINETKTALRENTHRGIVRIEWAQV